MTAIKIFLILTITAFFLPFFSLSVSYNPYDRGVAFSGFDISAWNILGVILIVPPVIHLILSFLVNRIKNGMFYNICKNIFFIAPVFNIFAVFIIRYAFKSLVPKIIFENSRGYISYDTAVNIIGVSIKPGFIFYIIFNVIIFILAVINYFMKRK